MTAPVAASEAMLPAEVGIAGGGLVGSALALALAGAGTRTLLFEPRRQPSAADTDRPIALSHASVRLLESLGLWGSLAPQAQPIRCVHVSERGRLGRVRMRAGELGVPALGQVIEASVLEHRLWQAVNERPEVEVHAGVRVTQFLTGVDAVDLALAGAVPCGPRIAVRLLVVADGATSDLLGSAGLAQRSEDYDQSAVVCSVQCARPHDGVAYERFLPTGPMALLPLADGRCGLVWTLPRVQAAEVVSDPDAAFLVRLRQAFGGRLGDFVAATPRHEFELLRHTTRPLTAPRVVCVGNAANRLHPVAGQGLNLGLRDVAHLAAALAEPSQGGLDPGAPEGLEAYCRRRAPDHRRILGFTHLLAVGFGGDGLLAGPVRSLGLIGLQLLPPARTALARMAMGLTPPLPAPVATDPVPPLGEARRDEVG